MGKREIVIKKREVSQIQVHLLRAFLPGRLEKRTCCGIVSLLEPADSGELVPFAALCGRGVFSLQVLEVEKGGIVFAVIDFLSDLSKRERTGCNRGSGCKRERTIYLGNDLGRFMSKSWEGGERQL